MPRRPLPIVAAVVGALSAAVPGQNVLTVGPNGGQYATLQAAIAAAQDDDLILVQAGGYNLGPGLVTNKALRILGGPGCTLLTDSNHPFLDLSGLAAGKTFVMDGFDVTRIFYGSGSMVDAIHLHNNAGAVHLANLTVTDSGFNHYSEILACALVTMTRCSTTLELQCYDSTLVLEQCTLRGLPGRDIGNSYNIQGTQALMAIRAEVHLVESTLIGGNGHITVPAQPAMGVGLSTVYLAGDANSRLAAGQPGTAPLSLASAVSLGITTLVYDPRIRLQPNPGAPVFDVFSPSTLTAAQQVFATNGGGTIGGSLGLAVGSPAGEPFVLCGGEITAQPQTTVLGPAWLSPAAAVPIALGVQGPGSSSSVSLAVPNLPLLRGVVLGFHAFAGGVAVPVQLSTLSTATLR